MFLGEAVLGNSGPGLRFADLPNNAVTVSVASGSVTVTPSAVTTTGRTLGTPTLLDKIHSTLGCSAGADTEKTPGATPVAGARLLMYFSTDATNAQTATFTPKDDQNLEWTTVTDLKPSNARRDIVLISKTTTLARSTQFWMNSSIALGGHTMIVVQVSGYPVVRLVSAVAQTATNSGASGTPSVVLPAAAGKDGGCVLTFLSTGSGTGSTGITVPTDSVAGAYTTLNDGGYTVPNHAGQAAVIPAWAADTTITWGTSSGTVWLATAIELRPAHPNQMQHLIPYGADLVRQVMRLYPPVGIAEGTTFGLHYSGPDNRWTTANDGINDFCHVYQSSNGRIFADMWNVRGVGGVWVQYRKCNEGHAYPKQEQDCHAACQWMIANGLAYGFDSSKGVSASAFSAGSHLWLLVALTGGVASVGGTGTPVGYIQGMIAQSTANRFRATDPWFTLLSITRGGGTIPPACNGAGDSPEAVLLGGANPSVSTIPCSLVSFDWLTGDSASLDTTWTLYNECQPSYAASQYVGSARTKFHLHHGKADTSLPWLGTYNDKALGGSGHQLDNGLYQDLVAAGWPASHSGVAVTDTLGNTTLWPGIGHGGTQFFPSSNPTSINGAQIDREIDWLMTAGGHSAAPPPPANVIAGTPRQPTQYD